MLPRLLILLLLLSSSAFANERAFDAVCKKYVSLKSFRRGDTTYWETRVIPEFKRVLGSQQLDNEAVMNAKFKALLAGHGFRGGEIDQHNQSRIISECASRPQMEGCFAMQAYCVRDFVEKELPLAATRTNQCLEPWNRKHCGQDFQSVRGIERNLSVLRKVESTLDETMDSALKKPHVPEYLDDVQTAFVSYSTRVREALARGKKSIEAIKKAEAARIQRAFDQAKKTMASLKSACDAFEKCSHYLKERGLSDRKEILSQITSCTLDTPPSNPLAAKSFSQAIATLRGVQNHEIRTELSSLAKKAFRETKAKAIEDYVAGHSRLMGRVPAFSSICGRTGGCDDPDLKDAFETAKSRASGGDRFDLDAQIASFNAQVKTLNAACGSGDLSRIQKSYQDVLYQSGLGSLLSLKSFASRVGSFDQEACIDDGEGLKLIRAEDKGKVQEALEEALDLHLQKIRELSAERSDLSDPNDPIPGIRHFLEREPLVLRELLRKENDPEKAMLLCREIEGIYRREKNRRIVSGALTGLSIAGALVATVLTGGTAAPLLIAAVGATSVGAGALASYRGFSHAKENVRTVQMSAVTGTIDRQVAQNFIQENRLEAKAEAVGLAMNFVPGAGKLAGAALKKTVVQPLVKSAMIQTMRESPSFVRLSQASKPVSQLVSKLSAQSDVVMDDVQKALAAKVGSKTTQSMVSSFNAVAKGMPEDVALTFSAMAIAHPDPYSEEGMLQMLESLVMSRGMASVGSAGRRYLGARQSKVTAAEPLADPAAESQPNFVRLPQAGSDLLVPARRHIHETDFFSRSTHAEIRPYALRNGTKVNSKTKFYLEKAPGSQEATIESVVLLKKEGLDRRTLGELTHNEGVPEFPVLRGRDADNHLFQIKRTDGSVQLLTPAELSMTPPQGYRYALQTQSSLFKKTGFSGGHSEKAWTETLKAYGDRIRIVPDKSSLLVFRVPGQNRSITANVYAYEVDGTLVKVPKSVIRGSDQELLDFEKAIEPLLKKALKDASPNDHEIRIPLEGADLVVFRSLERSDGAATLSLKSWFIQPQIKTKLLPERSASLDGRFGQAAKAPNQVNSARKETTLSPPNVPTARLDLPESLPGYILTDADKVKFNSWFDDPSLPAGEAERRTFESVIEKRLSLLDPEVAAQVREDLNQRVFAGPHVAKSAYNFGVRSIEIRIPEKYLNSAEKFHTLTHELEHSIQEKTVKSFAKKMGTDFNMVFEAEKAAMTAEWQYGHSIPKEKRLELSKEIQADSQLSRSDKTLIMRWLKNSDLPLERYLESEWNNSRYSYEGLEQSFQLQASKARQKHLRQSRNTASTVSKKAAFGLGAPVALVTGRCLWMRSRSSEKERQNSAFYQTLCKPLNL